MRKLVCFAYIWCLLLVGGFSSNAMEQADVFVQQGHTDVSSLAISPDGRYLVSGGWEGPMRLWDVETGRLVRSFAGHQWGVYSVAFSPDGRYVVSGSRDQTLKLWDVGSGKELRTFAGHQGTVGALTFTPDGRNIISSAGQDDMVEGSKNSLFLWDASTGEIVHSFGTFDEYVGAVDVSPDGRLAVTGGSKTKLWDVATGRPITDLASSSEYRECSVSFSPDGKSLLTAEWGGKVVNLWSVINGQLIKTYTAPEEISQIAFAPDGLRFFSDGPRSSINVWDVATGKILRSIPLERETSSALFALSRDGRYLAPTSDATIKLIELASGKVLREFKGVSGWQQARFLQNPEYMLTDDGTRQLWHLPSGRMVEPPGSLTGMALIAVSADARNSVYANSNSTFTILDNVSGKTIWTFATEPIEFPVAEFSPNGEILYIGEYNHVKKAFEVRTGRDVKLYDSGQFWPINLGREQEGMSVEYDKQQRELYFRQVESGKIVSRLYDVFGPKLSTDGRLVVYSDTNYTKILSAATGTEVFKIEGAGPVQVSPNGRYLVADLQTDGTLASWDLASGKELWRVKGHSGRVESLALSFDGRFLLSGGIDGYARIWDAATGRSIRTFSGHEAWIGSLDSTPDNQYLLTGGYDGTVRLWNMQNGGELVKFIGNNGEWIAVTSEGYYNASEHGDKYLNVRVGNNVYGMDQYREAFFRPDLVEIALTGGELKGFRTLVNIKQPPRVSIENTPGRVNSDEVAVTVKLVDNGGGIGDVRLYLNGSAIILDNGRGITIKQTDQGSAYKSYVVKLTNGLNTLRAVAFNADNTMQSTDAVQEITASFKADRKPNLHALIIGIDQFKNPKLTLKYAAADANLFAGTLQKTAGRLFEDSHITTLISPEQTTKEALLQTLASYQQLHPDDLFILYVASHGTVDDGEYFLLPSNTGALSTRKLREEAISQNTLKELIANVPSTKKLVILDTCNSGALGEAIQTAMLTRGMSEDTAMKILSRAVGSTILAASTSAQEALEGYNDHGLFTWVIVEGLKGKAGREGTGFIKTTELANYVEDEVPAIAEKVFKRAQYPTISISGQGFPIAVHEQ